MIYGCLKNYQPNNFRQHSPWIHPAHCGPFDSGTPSDRGMLQRICANGYPHQNNPIYIIHIISTIQSSAPVIHIAKSYLNVLYFMQAASKSIVHPSRRYSRSWIKVMSTLFDVTAGGTPFRIYIQILVVKWAILEKKKQQYDGLQYRWIASCSSRCCIDRTRVCWFSVGTLCEDGIWVPKMKT